MMTQKTGDMMQGVVITGGLLAALLAPWSSGLVKILAHGPVGYWVSFPEGYDMTLLSGVTTAITYAIGWWKLRAVRAQEREARKVNSARQEFLALEHEPS